MRLRRRAGCSRAARRHQKKSQARVRAWLLFPVDLLVAAARFLRMIPDNVDVSPPMSLLLLLGLFAFVVLAVYLGYLGYKGVQKKNETGSR